jgi:molybdenum cofactor biosynthesis protein MoaC
MAEATLQCVKEGRVAKGDVLEAARLAGLMAAKRTPDLLPHCHPLVLDGVQIDLEFAPSAILVTSTVRAVCRTGVEMEALTSASVALLTIYDMLKPIDKQMEITSIQLLEKSGGKTSFKEKIPSALKAAVIVTSTATLLGKREDKAGKIALDRLRGCGVESVEYVLLPDDREKIRNTLLHFCEVGTHFIFTAGGTGLGCTDVTVEASSEVITKPAPGIAEAMRGFGQKRTPYAMLSRGVAGVRGQSLIINLPGSSRGCEESLDALLPYIFHAYPMLVT